MSISIEQLTQILVEAAISSSQEEEILIVAKRFTTPPEANKEESQISEGEHMFELEIEEDEEWISGDHPTNKCCIQHCFQVSTRLDWFCFHFYSINFHFQYLISYITTYSRFSFSKLKDNFGLLLLDRWFHWKFHFM